MRTHFFHFLLAGPAFPVYIPSTSRTDSSVVERLSYTQLVGGSNPSPCTKSFLFEQKARTMKVRAFSLFFRGLINE